MIVGWGELDSGSVPEGEAAELVKVLRRDDFLEELCLEEEELFFEEEVDERKRLDSPLLEEWDLLERLDLELALDGDPVDSPIISAGRSLGLWRTDLRRSFFAEEEEPDLL